MKHENQADKPTFLIVGAGPAGLITGILLARKGYGAAILERETATHAPVCGEFLSPQGVELLKELGFESTIAGFRQIWGMALSSPAGKSVEAHFPQDRYGVALTRQVFQARLTEIFLAEGGLLFYGETLQAIETSSNFVSVTTNRQTHKADALIGADGRMSLVAKLAKLDRSLADHPRIALHCFLTPKAHAKPLGQMHIMKDGSYAGINPTSEQLVNFSIVADAKRLKEIHGAKNLINHYINTSPTLAENFNPIDSEKVKTTYPINCLRESAARGLVALIGDASGFIDPLTGEGITTAIKTSKLLVEKIEAIHSIPEAFASYASARGKNYRQKELMNLALQRVIRRPWACELIALVLKASPLIRAHFIGTIGNIYSPSEAILSALKGIFSPGGKIHGRDSFRTDRLPQTPLQTGGSDSAAQGHMAGSSSRARSVGENLRG